MVGVDGDKANDSIIAVSDQNERELEVHLCQTRDNTDRIEQLSENHVTSQVCGKGFNHCTYICVRANYAQDTIHYSRLFGVE